MKMMPRSLKKYDVGLPVNIKIVFKDPADNWTNYYLVAVTKFGVLICGRDADDGTPHCGDYTIAHWDEMASLRIVTK